MPKKKVGDKGVVGNAQPPYLVDRSDPPDKGVVGNAQPPYPAVCSFYFVTKVIQKWSIRGLWETHNPLIQWIAAIYPIRGLWETHNPLITLFLQLAA